MRGGAADGGGAAAHGVGVGAGGLGAARSAAWVSVVRPDMVSRPSCTRPTAASMTSWWSWLPAEAAARLPSVWSWEASSATASRCVSAPPVAPTAAPSTVVPAPPAPTAARRRRSGTPNVVLPSPAPQAETWLACIARATGRDPAWLGRLTDADGQALSAAMWQANQGFFGRRLVAALARRQMDGRSPSPKSSTPSSGPDTAAGTATSPSA